MLFVGVKLIGVYVTVHAIPALAALVELRELRWIWEGRSVGSDWHVLSRVTSTLLQLGLGIFLMLWSTKVGELITERKKTTQTTDASDSEPPEHPHQG
jgi:hypothetical protein